MNAVYIVILFTFAMAVSVATGHIAYPDNQFLSGLLANRILTGIVLLGVIEQTFRKGN